MPEVQEKAANIFRNIQRS